MDSIPLTDAAERLPYLRVIERGSRARAGAVRDGGAVATRGGNRTRAAAWCGRVATRPGCGSAQRPAVKGRRRDSGGASGLPAVRPAQLRVTGLSCFGTRCGVHDVVHELLATVVARDKLAARSISAAEVERLPHNIHRTVRNPREETEPGKRRLLIGETDGGRVLTLVIERTVEPTTWLVVTGWIATVAERNLLRR
jgi:hypothetical protein